MNRKTAQDDLAFMRALVEAPGNFQRSFGEAYFAAGLCYGVQMLAHAAQALGWLPDAGLPSLVIGIGPTFVFIALLSWIIVREQRAGRPAGGAIARAIAAVLSSIGIANLVLIFVIGLVAWRERSLTIWLIYPCTVMVLQGTAWMVIWALRRRAWFAVVAFGWFLTAGAMAVGVAYANFALFIGAGGLGFIAFMLAPGLVLMRQARTV
ncbi:MAG: hypothetical protein JNL41_02350 [Phenylobacterium sp.]|uniref:hypothetical protein n=1 Tax=Phenylobacterium sp. TaxID=1871053 RepID=UPI001A5FA61A|nr:hypothetical protein [Phenylobacterium sp.]MBL8553092.1 hypothetical protein [Phenylobacterium sp.]